MIHLFAWSVKQIVPTNLKQSWASGVKCLLREGNFATKTRNNESTKGKGGIENRLHIATFHSLFPFRVFVLSCFRCKIPFLKRLVEAE